MAFNQKFSRRQFMVGCSAAIAAMAGARIGKIAFAHPSLAANDTNDTLVVVFLRGGIDALNVMMPIDGADRKFYERARPRIKIPTSGKNAAINLNGQLGLHPAMKPLHEIFTQKHLAIVQAAGLQHDTRSHFDAMEYMELGTPGKKIGANGWITRHLLSSPNASDTLLMPSVSVGYQPTSLLAHEKTLAVSNVYDMNLFDDGGWRKEQRRILNGMYSGNHWIHRSGRSALNSMDTIQRIAGEEYKPNAGYPESEFGGSLKSIARMIKSDLGVRAATVDLGGWDTHQYQGENGEGMFGDLLGNLSAGLAAFYNDLAATGHDKRVTVVTMSEFGRRLVENENAGTDHGHASLMMVMGGNINGGLHGAWPGLAHDQLFENEDLAITTDFRRVLSEIVMKRLGNPNIDKVFPNYADYEAMGIVNA
jgi:uncharacterized protein (DUF1501 family)